MTVLILVRLVFYPLMALRRLRRGGLIFDRLYFGRHTARQLAEFRRSQFSDDDVQRAHRAYRAYQQGHQ